MEVNKSAGRAVVQQLLPWRCCYCRKVDGRDQGSGYTDGICADCLRQHFPQIADRVLAGAEVTPAGRVIH